MMKRLAFALALAAGLIAHAHAQTYPGQGPSVMAFGAHCDDSTDDTAAINAALAASSGIISIPANVKCRTTGSLILSNPNQCLIGSGPSSQIDFKPTNGTPAVPVVWIKNTATQACVRNLAINGNRTLLIAPTLLQGTIYGSAVVLEANSSSAIDLTISNAWDNGVSVVFIDSGGIQHNGSPSGAVVSNIQGTSNGLGSTSGATLDVGTGVATIVSNIWDTGSETAVILDTGGGASGTFTNLFSVGSLSFSYYIASGDSTFTNIEATSPGSSMWIDAGAQNVTIANCTIKSPTLDAILIKGANNIALIGCIEKDVPTNHDAVVIDTTAGNMIGIHLLENRVTHTSAAANRNGINVLGANQLKGSILGGFYEGLTNNMNNLPATMANMYGGDTGNWTVGGGNLKPRDILEIQGLGTFSASEFAGHPVQVQTGGVSGTDWAMPMGCDRTNQLCYLQSINVGTAKSTLSLNASGGNITIGNASSVATMSTPKLPAVAIAGLPACNAGLAGARATVNNGSAPTYLGAVGATGAVTVGVFCNGASWLYD